MSTSPSNSSDSTSLNWTTSLVERFSAVAKHVNDSIDLPSLQLALKSCLAIALATGLALWWDISATITAITAFMIQQGYVGSTLYRGTLRLIGGTVGALIALVLLGLFSQDRVLFISSIAICTGVIVYLLQGTRYWYAYILAAASLMVVGYGSIEQPQYSFQFFVNWVSGILLAVVVVTAVRALLWPNLTDDVFERQMRTNFKNCGKLLQLMLDSLVTGHDNNAAMDRLEKTLVRGLALPQTTLQTAFFDSWQVDRFEGAYNRLIDQVTLMAHRMIATRETLRLRQQSSETGDSGVRDIVRHSENLAAISRQMKGQMQDLIAALDQPRDGTSPSRDITKDKASLQESFDKLAKEIEQSESESFDKAVLLGIHQKLQPLTDHLAELHQTLLNVETAEARAAARRNPKTHSTAPPVKPRIIKAVTASVLVIAVATIWILTNWPLALNRVMVYTAVLACFNAMFPAIPRRAILNAVIWGIIGGGLMYFIVLRPMHGFLQLALALSIGLLPCCYFVNSANPMRMITGLFSGMILIGLLDISLQQSYSFSSFADNAIGYCGGFMIGMVILQLFVASTPEQNFRLQVLAFVQANQTSIQTLTNDPPWTDNGKSRLATEQHRLVKLFKLSAMWSKMFCPRQSAVHEPTRISELLASLQSIIIRYELLEHARFTSPDGSDFKTLRLGENEVRETIKQSLSDIHSIVQCNRNASQPSITRTKVRRILEPIRECFSTNTDERQGSIDVLILAAYYEALAAAIDECHEHVAAVDWPALERTYL